MKRAWVILPILLFAGMIHGQSYSTRSKKAIKQFDEAVALYQQKDQVGAEAALEKAIVADDNFIEAYGLLSQICYELGRIDEAIGYYGTTLEIDSIGNPDGYRILAGLVLRTGDYDRAPGRRNLDGHRAHLEIARFRHQPPMGDELFRMVWR